ncbi:helix-turn-helix transcriptional regulator [Photorhabdus tasmaniensis]|uniref:Transcriptional regulator n=1 Tax=Photorhabdus tasmaniensis TaxID=1004159 RepID=A0ABX0GLX6_9GAMM|nr:WYL domain-containing protein [Photorhabdus tasmaniensis]NHB89836.1 transcriptional regulator [Photorhabdus tasmaniensis]
MNNTATRYDRFAIRLTQIISRLLSGESLDLKTLAEEFGVSERTLQRDFHQRLLHLNIVSENGRWRLDGKRFSDSSLDLLAFMRNTGITHLFPSPDRRLIHYLTGETSYSPCLIWPSLHTDSVVPSECFHRLIQAVCQQNCIRLLTGDDSHEALEPYRLIHTEGNWYLVACQAGIIRVIPVASISLVTLTTENFVRRDDICDLTAGERFVASLPHFPYIHDVMNSINYRSYKKCLSSKNQY